MRILSKFFTIFYMSAIFSYPVQSATLPEFAINTYQNHELSRSEQKCIDEGYKITYATCANQTAPSERCPHHDSYYKSCSQEQWCRNNNYTFSEADCKSPFFPFKMCANKFPLYRICKEDIEKSCIDAGFTHKSKCQLTDTKCPFSADYGICCNDCPTFSHDINNIPEGYIATGETCTTCNGITKTNITPAPCEGFSICEFGPMSEITPSCKQADKILYSACKTSADICKDNGFVYTFCQETEDSTSCPDNPNFKKCSPNCLKQSQNNYPSADIFGQDITDPIINISKKELRSLIGMPFPSCQEQNRPELTLHINHKNLAMYENLFDKDIQNINFNIIFEDPIKLSFNGHLNNVKIKASGQIPECPLSGELTTISGIVSISGIPTICSNFQINNGSKLLSTGDINGNVEVLKDASLGIKGNLLGNLKAHSYTEIFIKGKLEYTSTPESALPIIFGCNSKVKIESGIIANKTPVILKQWTNLDTSSIKLISTSDRPDLANTLSSVQMYRYAKIFNAYGDTVYPLAENDGLQCDNMQYVHLGSATDINKQEFILEPANLITDSWQCQTLDTKQQECD
ncbi:MAG: hypothetical protein E7012_02280 [Alphaproteobacteria bacterium]|nr:hypothetical protein [Alphaproteobacteria bacterium]